MYASIFVWSKHNIINMWCLYPCISFFSLFRLMLRLFLKDKDDATECWRKKIEPTNVYTSVPVPFFIKRGNCTVHCDKSNNWILVGYKLWSNGMDLIVRFFFNLLQIHTMQNNCSENCFCCSNSASIWWHSNIYM